MVGRIRYTQEFKMGAVAQITERGHFRKVGIKQAWRKHEVALRLDKALRD